MSSSVSLSNLIGQFGGIRSSSTGPTLQATGGPPAGHSAYHYAYTVSGGLDLPNGTETGLVIRVEGWAGYADQGPLFQDGRIITVIDDLAGNMLFQHMQPPAALDGLRDIGGLLSVDEVVKIAAYRGSAAQGDISGTVLEILEGQVRTEILDARRQSVPASMFGAGPAAACDCSCDGLTAFKQFADLPRSQQEQDPRAMTLISCGRQCARQWALGCHP
jgi:hypothetical protein